MQPRPILTRNYQTTPSPIDSLTTRWAAKHDITLAPAPDNQYSATHNPTNTTTLAASPRAAFAACLRALLPPAPNASPAQPHASAPHSAPYATPANGAAPQREQWLDVALKRNQVITVQGYLGRPNTKQQVFYHRLKTGMTVGDALHQGAGIVPDSTLRAYLQRLALNGSITLS